MLSKTEALNPEHQSVLTELQTPASALDEKVDIAPEWLEVLTGKPLTSGNGDSKIKMEANDADKNPDYEKVKGTTFVDDSGNTTTDAEAGIKLNDVQQGALGDCYFLATLAAVARTRPERIKEIITDHGDGTYTVNFTLSGIFSNYTEPVTVDSSFWRNSADTPIYAKEGDTSSADGPELWVMIIEKAWAKLHGGYGEITGSKADHDARLAITGKEAEYISPSGMTADELFNKVKAHFKDNDKPIIFWSNKGGKDNPKAEKKLQADGVVGNHEYVLQGVNEANKTFSLYNPWGSDHLENKDADFIKKHFQKVRFLDI
ncbi:MAG: C2 family cysteine protease [Myxococcota bacterium]